MRQPLRQLSIPKPWQHQKQQCERPEIFCMNRSSIASQMNRSSIASQIQYQHQPNAPFSEGKKQARGCKPTNLRYGGNGTCLSDMEFRFALHLRYCRTSPNLPTHCDRCGARFSTAHGLACKKGGLVIQRHDEIKFELQDHAASALNSSVARDESQIYQVVVQMLKRLQDRLHQQKNLVIFSLGTFVNNKMIALWTCVLRIL